MKQNTPIQVQKVTTGEKRTLSKQLRKKLFRAERNYRICRHIVGVLRVRGLITGQDAAKMLLRIQKHYRPQIGTLEDFEGWKD